MPCSLFCTDCPDPSPPIPSDYSIRGLGIQPHCRNAEWALVIRSEKRQEDWVAYTPRRHAFDITQLDTAIRYRGKLYRIMNVDEKPSGWTYRLVNWPQGENFQSVVDLAPEAFAKAQAERALLKRSHRLSAWSVYYEFLFGFLPARLQDQLGVPFCFDPAEASRRSGAVEFLLCFVLTILAANQVLRYSNSHYVLPGIILPLLAIEGAIRWGQATVSDRPIGCLLMEVFDLLLPRSNAEQGTR